jgi:DNA-binding HxlR family transcriptional regulator
MGGRWKALIIDRLMKQPLRYSELKRSIPPASERVLTLHLKELEQDGLLLKTIIVETPPKIIEYQLTEKGKSLVNVLMQLYEWGKNNRHAVPIPG